MKGPTVVEGELGKTNLGKFPFRLAKESTKKRRKFSREKKRKFPSRFLPSVCVCVCFVSSFLGTLEG